PAAPLYNKPMDKTTFFQIQTYLAANNIAAIDTASTKMHQRAQGRHFTLEEHIKAMLFALLSAQMVWKKIEDNEENIDTLFFHYNPENIKQHDPQYYIDGLAQLKCRNRLTNANMQALHTNIETMQRIEKEYGSMDAFVTSENQLSIVEKLTNPASPYKIRRMGPALAWEYLRNIGVDAAKPDVHLKRLFGKSRLGISARETATDAEVLAAVRKLSEETGLYMAEIDYLLWCYCATGKAAICTANPSCEKCVIRKNCKRGQADLLCAENETKTQTTGEKEEINDEEKEDDGFLKAIEHALNETYPGTRVHIRDTNLTPDLIRQYKRGEILLEPSYAEGSIFSKGGMRTSARYMILSSHMHSLDKLMDENKTLAGYGPKGCGLHIAQRDSHFRVLDNYTFHEKTLITLLHLPDDETWKLFHQIDNWQGADGEFVEYCRKAFEERCDLAPRPELDTPDILRRWKYPLGFDDEGKPYESSPLGNLDAVFHFRYLLEHSVLPRAVLLDTEKTLALLTFEKEKFLAQIAAGIAEKTGEENPYTESDFRVFPIPAKNVNGILISMPEAVKELQCRRIYITFAMENKKPAHVRYFTVEKGKQKLHDDKARDFLCEWTADGKHRNHGTVEGFEDEALYIEAFCGRINFRIEVEANTLRGMFCEKPQTFLANVKKWQGAYIAAIYNQVAEMFHVKKSYDAGDFRIGFFETGDFTGCRIRLLEPAGFMQCSRVYLVTKKDYSLPLYFAVQKRAGPGAMEGECPVYTDVMYGFAGDDICCLGCVKRIEDDIARIRILLNE
ncbi:MAG TPA: hypothetical protein O0X70_07225, partial [Methanocorpusculum sp.]|nr:hypothetical protein [Methanocorpusculum sp.]